MGGIVCKKCKTINKDTSAICESCGSPINRNMGNTEFVNLQITSKQPETKKCQYCQTEIPFAASICPNCKRTLSADQKLFDGISRIFLILAIIGIILFVLHFVSCETTATIEPISTEQTNSIYDY